MEIDVIKYGANWRDKIVKKLCILWTELVIYWYCMNGKYREAYKITFDGNSRHKIWCKFMSY